MPPQQNKVALYYFKRHAKRAAKAASTARPPPCHDQVQDVRYIPLPPTIQISDFVTLKAIHSSPGGIGNITQVCNRSDTSERYTLKTFPKNVVRRKAVFSAVMTELDVYKRIASLRNSKFLNEAFAAFQDSVNLYLLLPFRSAVLRDGIGVIPHSVVPNIILQIATGISTLHSIGIIHRNLRPSNILLSPSLSVTITDFSLAYLHHIPTPIQRGHLCLRNAVGSVEYLAPEVLSSRGYDNMVDYWALGILMFEVLCGRLPFTLESLAEYYKHPWYECAPYWTIEAGLRRQEASVLAGLLQCSSTNRFDFAQLKDLDYFHDSRLASTASVVIESKCTEPPVLNSEPENDNLFSNLESYEMMQRKEARLGFEKFDWISPRKEFL